MLTGLGIAWSDYWRISTPIILMGGGLFIGSCISYAIMDKKSITSAKENKP